MSFASRMHELSSRLGLSSRRRKQRGDRPEDNLRLEQLEDRTVPSAAAQFVPGEILVGLDSSFAATHRAQGASTALQAAGRLVGAHGLHNPQALLALPASAGNAGRLITKWSVPFGTDIPALAAKLARLPGVAYAEPNGIVTAAEVDVLDASFTATPESDWGTRYGLQDHLVGTTVSGESTKSIDAVAAWEVAGVNFGAGVRVAVIDSGIDLDHPDLAANLARNMDGSVLGANFVTPGASPDDDHYVSHGTHVAGIIAAVLNNTGERALGTTDASWNGGVVGVAPQAELMPVKIFDSTGHGTWAWVIQGMDWAVANGAKILSMSVGGVGFSQSVYDAAQRAYDANVLIVAAAGNHNNSVPYQPASYPMTLSVAAVDRNDVRASFSNYTSAVDISAPGVSILSTAIDSPDDAFDGYRRLSGTSMATPVVTGVATLILAQNPTWTPAQIAAQIVGSADDIYDLPGNEGYANLLGSGRVNAYKAVTATLTRPQVVSTSSTFERFTLNDPIVVRFGQGMDTDIDALINGQPANFEIRYDANNDGFFAANERVNINVFDYDGVGGMPAGYVLGPNLVLQLTQLNAGNYQLIVKGGATGVKDAFGNTLGDANGNAVAEYITNFTIESITRTFTNSTAKVLKDNALTSSTLSVSIPGTHVIEDLDVEVNISHVNVGDLQLVLKSPQGVAVTLASNNGGTGDHFTGTIFDDAANLAINQGTAPFTGRFRVTTASALQLAAFNGANPNGAWTLEIRDTAKNGIAGTLTSWKLHITSPQSSTVPPPTLSISSVTQTEGNSGWTAFVFTVSLSAPSTSTVTVNYSTANGTASSGGGANSDYQALSGTLTFAPGKTTKTITVLVRGDTRNESNETFFVNLSNAVGATIDDGQGLGTILNDD